MCFPRKLQEMLPLNSLLSLAYTQKACIMFMNRSLKLMVVKVNLIDIDQFLDSTEVLPILSTGARVGFPPWG